MTDAIAHRGPEGEGFWISSNGRVGFGHRRLSIIDLSEAGAQPMHYMERYTITYNGEIYNYLEVKQALEKQGYHFKSSCDTEVILAAYACYGKNCLQHFDGMFAFAIWDELEQKLFCARDRFGEKPFYLFTDQTQLVFASEIKALHAAGIGKAINNSMLLNYLTIGFTSDPSDPSATFFNDIKKLPAAHCMEIDVKQQQLHIHQWQYWDIDKEAQLELKEEEYIDRFAQLFETSIQRRLRSDVAIGSSLSGGLDSSSIVAVINNIIGDATRQKTFSAVFPGFEKDESLYINKVVQQFKVDNYTVTPTALGFADDFQKLVHHQDEPFQSSSIYAQYKVYELAKQHDVTVILDGQGADEILAGYNKYYHWYWQELVRKEDWKKAKHEQKAAANNGVRAEWSWKNYVAAYMPTLTARQLEKKANAQQASLEFMHQDFIEQYRDKSSVQKPVVEKLNDILYFNTMQQGLEELLRYADRNSMAHSREVRLPFLNHELVQFVFSAPSSMKINKGFTKYLLRLVMDTVLPQPIVWRKDKVGYEPPQQQWMQQQPVVDIIMQSREKLVQQGVLDKRVLHEPIRAHAAHDAGNFDWRYLSAATALLP